MRAALAAAGATLVALGALYAGLGYWLAPDLIRDALVERAREAGLDLRVEAVSTHPFALAVELHDVRVSTLDGVRLFYAQRAVADLSASSAWSRAWVVDRVALDQPALTALPTFGAKRGAAPLPHVQMRKLRVTQGVLALEAVPRLEKLTLEARELSTFGERAGSYEADAVPAHGGKLASKGTLCLAPLAADGELALENASLADAWRYLPANMGRAPRGTLDGSLAFRYRDGRLSIEDFHGDARLQSGARLAAGGTLALQPLRAELDLDGAALPLELFAPLVEGHAAVRIAAGALSGKGRLRLGGGQPRYAGSLVLRDGRIDETGGERLLAWQRLASDGMTIDFSPFGLHADEIVATAAHGRIAIDEKGRLNFTQVLAAGEKRAQAPERALIEIARLRVEEGSLEFSDRSLPGPFGTTARELSGTVAGISTKPGAAAHVQLDGRVGRYGHARVRGTVDLAARTSLTDLRARLRNLALADFTPYAAEFAGYRIKSGRLNATLHYRVRDARLVGTNQLEFEKLKLGEKVFELSAGR